MPGITPQGQLRTNKDDIPSHGTSSTQLADSLGVAVQWVLSPELRNPNTTILGMSHNESEITVTCQGHVTGGAKVTCAIPKTPGLVVWRGRLSSSLGMRSHKSSYFSLFVGIIFGGSPPNGVRGRCVGCSRDGLRRNRNTRGGVGASDPSARATPAPRVYAPRHTRGRRRVGAPSPAPLHARCATPALRFTRRTQEEECVGRTQARTRRGSRNEAVKLEREVNRGAAQRGGAERGATRVARGVARERKGGRIGAGMRKGDGDGDGGS
ncbi:hypothetical protein EDB83DRAFT_2556104 [Lactarius deliciosus]|nr:hypothetical protein EDB83DRAFT_2556104 [Lactarius deliciosus]